MSSCCIRQEVQLLVMLLEKIIASMENIQLWTTYHISAKFNRNYNYGTVPFNRTLMPYLT